MSFESNQIAAISRLFSSAVIKEMARAGRSPLFTRLAREASLFDMRCLNSRVSDVFEDAFSILKKKAHRHEYVYKAALTQNILLGTHSLQTASMLTEFRVADCKADLAILNGTATVYEIKSERDTLSRLERQLTAYRSVFAKVYVIAGENHVEAVLQSAPPDVGVMQLSARSNITPIRSAIERPERTSSLSICDAIRSNEAKRILELYGILVPDVPNTELHSVVRENFGKLTSVQAHTGMVRVLKATRNLKPLSSLVGRLPSSLHTAALSTTFRKIDHEKLVQAANASLSDALMWV